MRRSLFGLQMSLIIAVVAGMPVIATAESQASLHHAGDTAVLTLHAVGVQTYACRAMESGSSEWTFMAPDADLYDGAERVGHHSAGPTWAYRDGSRITAKLVAKADGSTVQDITWLRLAVASHVGSGALSAVDAVLRTDTRGGTLQGACDRIGATKDVPYEANYTFVRQP